MRLRKIYLTRRLSAPIIAEAPSSEALAATKGRSTVTLLTPRQRQVFAFVAKGQRSHEVARRQGITLHEVVTYRRHAMRKLEASPLSDMYPSARCNERIGAH
jgi:DNA-binding CsgD family transcriptional regulator